MLPDDVIDGRFRLLTREAKGGGGSVFRATDLETGTIVAVKHVHGLEEDDVGRFRREAQVLERLRHPNVVEYITHGCTPDGENYLVMDWLVGTDLLEHLQKDGPLSVEETRIVATGIAGALTAAHTEKIVHRDIKPSNVFLVDGQVDQVRVLDFGIARLLDTGGPKTATGIVLGTVGYMAPEQACGKKEIGPSADIFSLGCVLFACLTKRQPFQGTDMMSVLIKILLEEPPRVRQFRPEIPRSIDRFVRKLMSKLPADRPSDGRAVLEALDVLSHSDSGGMATIETGLSKLEQRTVSLVLAGESNVSGDDAPTVVIRGQCDTSPELTALREALELYDVIVEQLADKTMIVYVPPGGVPTDHAATAARCALAAQALLPHRAVALVTGRAVMGERLPIGDVVDRAGTALRSAPPDCVSIDDFTRDLLGPRFVVDTVGGKSRLIAENTDLAKQPKLLGVTTQCVGRNRELDILNGTYDACRTEPRACAVLLTGDAGIGKSRLAMEFLYRLTQLKQSPTVLFGVSDAFSKQHAFGLLSDTICRAANVVEGEPNALKRAKLRIWFGRCLEGDELTRVTDFVGDMVGISHGPDESVQLTLARDDSRLMADQKRLALNDWLDAECAHSPLVLVLDDIQSADQATLKFIDTALKDFQDRPLMILALARPEILKDAPRLWDRRNLTHIRLAGLSSKASAELVEQALGDQLESPEKDALVETAGGNAFFLETLIRAKARGEQDKSPPTVLAMVEYRLSQLGEGARYVLRAASLFSTGFSNTGVQAVLGNDDGIDIEEGLGELVEEELIFSQSRKAIAGLREYGFAHGLIRETAYAMLTPEDRAIGHRNAGEWLKSLERSDPAALAMHFELGGRFDQAALFLLQAAEDALSSSDLETADSLATSGLRCDTTHLHHGALWLVQAQAQLENHNSVEAAKRAEDALENLDVGTARWYRAVNVTALAHGRLGNREKVLRCADLLESAKPDKAATNTCRIAALHSVSELLILGGESKRLPSFLDTLTDAADTLNPSSPLESAHFYQAKGAQTYLDGDLSEAIAHQETAATYFQEAGDMRLAGEERIKAAFFHLQVGHFERCVSLSNAILLTAQRLKLPALEASATMCLGLGQAGTGNFREGRENVEQAMAWFRERGDKSFEGRGRISLALIRLGEGDVSGALELAELIADVVRDSPYLYSLALSACAMAQLASGQAEKALATIQEAIASYEKFGRYEWGDLQIRMVHVEALNAVSGREAAEEPLREAIAALTERANRISDPDVRMTFLERVPEHMRLRALAKTWGLESTI